MGKKRGFASSLVGRKKKRRTGERDGGRVIAIGKAEESSSRV